MDCLTNPFSLKNRKKSSITAAVAVAACSFFVQGTPSAHAFSAPNSYQNGAPFSNGTFFSNDGTFQGTIRAKNLSGAIVFSTVSGSGLSEAPSMGIFSVNFNGVTYAGNVNSSIDTAAGEIAATMEASVERMGNGEIITQFLDDVVYVTTTVDGADITEPFIAQATTTFNDVLYCSGSFIANLFPTYPMQAFKGDGQMSFKEVDLTVSPTSSDANDIPTIKTTTVDIAVDGVRTSNAAQIYIPTTVEVPFAVTTFQLVAPGDTGGGDE